MHRRRRHHAAAGAVGLLLVGAVVASPTVARADSTPGPTSSTVTSTPTSPPTSPPVTSPTTTSTTAPTGSSTTPTTPPTTSTTTTATTRNPATTTPPSPSSTTKARPSTSTLSPAATSPGDDAITARWTQLGGSGGVLGDPTGAPQAVPGGEFQDFAHGRITWSSATGAWETLGATNDRYVAVGGAPSLGFPTGSATATGSGTVQVFTGARIWFSAATGAWETFGAIGARYLALGGAASQGFPTGAEQAVAGGSQQVFGSIRIWWSAATGAWETFGAIGARYLALGGAASQGFPAGSEQGVASGSQQVFGKIRIWWSAATGAWETFGAIGARYLALGGAASQGFPTGSEQAVAGGSQQGFGAIRIWWSAASGAWETFGAIDARFRAIGGPSSFGFPLTPEQAGAGGTWQWFTGGSIWWSPSTGAWEITGDLAAQFNTAGGAVYSFYGFPTGAAYGYYGGTRQDFRGGSLLSGVQPVLDVTYSGVTAADVWATWRPGCPVGPSSLTLLRLNYWGFDNAIHRGEIIVRTDLAPRVANVFQAALDDHFLIKKMWRVDYYGGDDPTAMAADDTSGFNCRQVTGGTGLSPHSYGIAIDVNTLENPYWAANRWWPNADYTNRSVIRDGMLFSYSRTTQAFANNGYEWGASYLDYQHFEYVG